MDIEDLFHIQKQLDESIIKNHGLDPEGLLAAKILALSVELGELANETRCFKFWSRQGASSRTLILEEYVDCLHFLLSIGLDLDYSHINIQVKKKELELINQFQRVFTGISKLSKTLAEEDYLDLFREFLYLGQGLDFSWDEVSRGYLIKNKINYQRQAEGY